MDDRVPTWAIVADYASRLDQAEKAAAAEHRWWRNYVALLPYTVPAVAKPFIPAQRAASTAGRPVDLRPPRTSRFLDNRTKGHL